MLAPLSEFFGRRPIYLGGLTAFFLATILVAQAKNVTGWLIGRLLQGVAGSAFLSVAGELFQTLQLPSLSSIIEILASSRSVTNLLCRWLCGRFVQH